MSDTVRASRGAAAQEGAKPWLAINMGHAPDFEPVYKRYATIQDALNDEQVREALQYRPVQ